ncbi:MAG: hypothetical protein KDD45_02790 [Bdellovibrionales bacterium]|nr:hypothetical protein [Bdellovibrionales bacterium]
MIEFFKLPSGGLPSFVPLLGRAFIAAIMLASFPEFLNIVGDLVDGLSSRIGELNEFKYVLAQMGDQLDKLTWSWTSVKQMTIVVISFLAFFILYISVYISEAIYFYSWTLLYIFSPLCFALYVLPQTQNAAIGVYRSIIKVSSWKLIWSVLATLLWSAALTDLEKLGDSANFLTIILFNLMLAGSLLFTPLIANLLFSGNFAQAATKAGSFAVGSAMMGAGKLVGAAGMKNAGQLAKHLPQKGFDSARNYMNARKDQRALQKNPDLKKSPEKLPSHIAEMNKQNKAYEKLDKAAIKNRPYLKHMPERLPSSIKRLEADEKNERLHQRRDRLEKAKIKRRTEQ